MTERQDNLAALLDEQEPDETSAPTIELSSLPGVGASSMPLRDGLRRGGFFTFTTLLVLNSLDELEGAAITILGPDIADTFNVSDGTVTFLSVASVAFFILGAGPMGWLADRTRRGPLVGLASAAFAGFAVMSGLAVNVFMFFWMRFFTGISKSNTITVHPSILADAYPIPVRARMFASVAGAGRAASALSPILVGAIAAIAGGVAGWRWAYIVLGFPIALFAVLAFFIPEPKRGQWEQDDVLGEQLADDESMPISVEAAFARIWQIGTIRTITVAVSALGFALFPAQAIQSFFLEEQYGLDAFERGLAVAPTGIGLLLVLPMVGRRFDGLFRTAPDKALAWIGLLLLPVAVIVPVQYAMPNVVLFVLFGTLSGTLLGSAFAMISPLIQAVVPYRLRGMGAAIATFFIFAVGGVGGGLISAFLQDTVGERPTIVTLTVITIPVGALLILRGSRLILDDLHLVVTELEEEREELQRRTEAGPGGTPAVQVNNINFSYGQLQILFDLAFEVKKGESLALLGTNGAGKSTILRIITGLATPQTGVVRLHGRTITYATPEQRSRMGIHMLPGGEGTFRAMTVRDNLRVSALQYRSEPDGVESRIDAVLERLPAVRELLPKRAGDLSGGQQQLVALARVLLHEPDILIIDELSLGLAPAVVQELLQTIEQLRADGQTMIIVEQSLNVALSISDRAVFLEKGRVRFEGPASELLERDDLARAVFLGGEGG